MKFSILIPPLLLAAFSSSRGSVLLHGDFAPGPNWVEASPAANAYDLTAWKGRVAGAFAGGSGGVVNFDDADDIAAFIHGINSYELRHHSGMIITTFSNELSGSNYLGANPSPDRLPVSGNNRLAVGSDAGGAENRNDFSLGFSPGVVEVGFVVLSREARNILDVMAIATFSGGGARTITFDLIDPNNGVLGEDDTLINFKAPVGQTISNLYLDFPTFSFSAIDDLAVIIIPEAGSVYFLFLSAGVLMRRHR